MRKKNKKTIVIIFGIMSIVFLASFLSATNEPATAPISPTKVDFEMLNASDLTNLDIINEIFDSKNSDYSTYGYYPQVYSDSLQAIYYALFVLDSIGKLGEIDQGKLITYIMSFYNSTSHQFVDTHAKRYLASSIPGRYIPLNTLLEVNCYGVLSLDVLNSLHLIDTAKTIDFIWECYHPNLHGFIGQPYNASLDEGFKIPTADNTYYAVITLDLLMTSWSAYSQERNGIVSYIDGLQSVGSHTGFYNDNDPLFDSIFEIEPNQFASFYAIKTLETFGSGYVDVIDMVRFHQDLTDLYHPADFYFDISSVAWHANYTNIVATAINLELSDITGFTNISRNEVIDFIIDNRKALGGWDASTTIKFHAIISSYDYFDRIAELDIQELYELLEESALYTGGQYEFLACTKLDPNIAGFRSQPLDYYTVGYHKPIENINALYSHKEMYRTLNSLQKIFKLNDFASSHDLNSVLQGVIDSQFLDPDYQENFGAFLFDDVFHTSEWKNQLIYMQYSFYAIKVMELIAEYLGLGPITNLSFDKTALANYIVGNMVELPSELYFEEENSESVEIALENTYYAIYVLKAIDNYALDSAKIENFVFNNLNYSSVKNLYYSYKISEILDLEITFDVDQSHALIQSIYSDTYHEFFKTTEMNALEQEGFAWVCEMAQDDSVRINAWYFDSIQLGGNNSISVELCNLIVSNFGQSLTVKLESEQLGTFLLDKMENHTYQKEIHVAIDPQNYSLIEGDLCVYDGSVKVGQYPLSFQTTIDSSYNFSTLKTESQIEITVNASLRFASGEQPVYDGDVRADVYRNGTYIETISFASEDGLKSTNFTFIYQPVEFGNYFFEIHMVDPYHSSSQFIFNTTYAYSSNSDNPPPGPPSGDDPIKTFENDANLTIPLAMVILTAGSGGFVTSIKKSKNKGKNKLRKTKAKAKTKTK